MANARQPLRILIVDDQERIADTLAAIVRNWGHDVFVEHAAKLALLAAKRFKPDLLLTDVVMPEMDGVALAEHFYEHCPDCKIIFMSGNAASGPLLAMADRRGYQYVFACEAISPTRTSSHSRYDAAIRHYRFCLKSRVSRLIDANVSRVWAWGLDRSCGGLSPAAGEVAPIGNRDRHALSPRLIVPALPSNTTR